MRTLYSIILASVWYCFVALSLFFVTDAAHAEIEKIKIMPLGDSITQSDATHDSYRRPLWQALQAGGYNADFVGSLSTNHNGGPPHTDFDPDHEGHWGWRADEILANIGTWASATTPDVVLLHLGTNDIFQGQSVSSTITELGQIIDALRVANPRVAVLLAKVVPNSRPDRPSPDALNAEITTLAANKTSTLSPVILVDQAQGFNAVTDTFDNVHPNAAGEQKMSDRWFAALQPVLDSIQKRRLIVLTDIGGDPDDQQSMVRLMTHSNECDIEGLVATSRMGHGQDTMPELIEEIVSAYGQVRSNLNLHASGWPTEQYLMDRVKNGQGNQYSVGAGYDTEGSNHIISVVDANDPRPVWIAIWGGSRELRQALWRVTQDRSQSEVDAFVAKMRVYAIADQDGHAQWIMQQFPGLWYIHSIDFPGVDQSASFRGMYQNDTRQQNATNLGWRVAPSEYTTAEKDAWDQLVKTAWVNANVHGHGSLGDLYPTNVWQGPTGGSWPHNGPGGVKEGDAPSWFYILPNGLNVPDQPGFGGWGGRFEQDDPARPLFSAAADSHNTAPTDQVLGQVWTVARWREHYQNDFAARMDWCVQASANANHHPLAVLNGDSGRGILNLSVQAGTMVNLSAAGSTDPDGDALSYEWLYYKEAGSYGGALTINGATGQQASFTAPNVTSEKTIHIVLIVTDNGTPALTTCRRAVITVTPEGAGSIVSNVSAASGKSYQVVEGGLSVGAVQYIDRTFTFASVPVELEGATYIKTANDDKSAAGDPFLTFVVNQNVTVYVAHDDRIARPSWLGTFSDTEEDLAANDIFSLFAKDFPPGTVSLGSNGATGSSSAMYTVIIVGRGSGPGPAPVGHWKLDEGAGSTTADSSSNSLNGSLINGPVWTAGKQAGALEFDGVNDYVALGNPTALRLTGAMTLSAWVYIDTFTNSGRIISKQGNSGARGWSLAVESAGSTASFQVASTASNLVNVNTAGNAGGTSNGALPTGQWVHLAGVYEPGVALRIFVNGVLNNSATAGVPANQYNSDRNVLIGARPNTNSAPGLFFDGKIDEVRVYDHVLSGPEIQALSNSAVNQAPQAGAGPDQTIVLPAAAALSGTITDDGLPDPPGVATSAWSLVDGPGTVVFADAAAVSTSATFNEPGDYVLRFTANDGELSASDEVTVTVDDSLDAWKTRWNIVGDPGDGDGDGIALVLEYGLNLDPTKADLAGLPTVELQGDFLTITYTRVVASTDLDYMVKVSGDMIEWGPDTEQVGLPADNGNGTESVTERDTVPIGEAEARYIRLEVTRFP